MMNIQIKQLLSHIRRSRLEVSPHCLMARSRQRHPPDLESMLAAAHTGSFGSSPRPRGT